MTPIYKHKNGATIYQCGYREIPHDLKKANIGLVLFMAEECPPLNHHTGAKVEYYPTDDAMMRPGSMEYIQMVATATKAAKSAIKYLNNGQNVISSCHAGRNRSGLVTGLVLKELTNANPEQVVQWIQRKRQDALSNPSFVNMLY